MTLIDREIETKIGPYLKERQRKREKLINRQLERKMFVCKVRENQRKRKKEEIEKVMRKN